jgi:hypothetical protein
MIRLNSLAPKFPVYYREAYDVMAALQTVVESDEDDLVVAVMVDWLRSGVAPVSGT